MKRSGLFIGMMLVFAVVFAACESESEPKASSAVKETTGPVASAATKISGFKEAPMLAKLVTAGSLKPVTDRLPVKEDIMVEKVTDEIGKYGGDWKMPWAGPNDRWTVGAPTEESLFRFNKDGSTVEPNVAKSFEVNKDSTEFTIHLRKGMKWSDGMPFTADDVLFYWEHMLTKETFGKKIYDAYYSIDPVSGEKALATVTKVDDYTFKITHKYPSVLFLERVAIDNKWFFAPAHFQKTILPEFVGDAKALEIAKQWGFADVKSFLVATGYYDWINPQIPNLRPWVAKNDPNSDQFIMERNPYYWKVDSEGNQLPYMDRLVATKVQDPAQRVLGALAGDYNLLDFDFKDFTVLKENEKKAAFTVTPWTQAAWSSAGLQFNQTIGDPNLRKLFQDIKFREAVSVAVDRKEISEIVTNGLGAPQQASVPEGLVGYQKGWADQWSKFDPARANQLLDEIGLTKRDKNNFRLNADGSDLTITVIENTTNTATFLELVKKYYEKVGIKVDIKVVDAGTHNDLKYANKIPATTENISLVNVAFRPDTLVPLRVLTPWLGNYGLYTSSNGKDGVKPEGDIALILDYWNKVKSSTTKEDITKWSNEIIKLNQKNQWLIGYAGPTPKLIVASNKIGNVPKNLIYADEFRSLGHGHPSQFFIKQ
ncbi:ABC transporter substrate-binding protein [Paenibacillus allorhizoplanae]|uniref:ABC transporter substrate-binding protein n=1 Tax=Paenibacillus allorhizoplanae TaxID=2905648 RepID=UPI001F314F3A|nr:ABC transporter substrate-binding protein [Paenibacillus allorhizoplanae]